MPFWAVAEPDMTLKQETNVRTLFLAPNFRVALRVTDTPENSNCG